MHEPAMLRRRGAALCVLGKAFAAEPFAGSLLGAPGDPRHCSTGGAHGVGGFQCHWAWGCSMATPQDVGLHRDFPRTPEVPIGVPQAVGPNTPRAAPWVGRHSPSAEPGAEAAHAPRVVLHSADVSSCCWKNEISEQSRPWCSYVKWDCFV